MNFIYNNKLLVAGLLLGSVAGYFYYYFFGCTGSCTITSSPVNSTLYGAVMGGLFFNIFKTSKKNPNSSLMEKLIKENNCTIIDVRTPSEFSSGHVSGSVNIPLHEIPVRLEELKSMKIPLVFCCASGGRSEQATQFISGQGIECYNAGSWRDVNYLK